MPTIHIMSPTLASQVAAGEVVERPASVVKELVENSLDAGAKSVRVEIHRGGIGLIKVTDDGCGMTKEDVQLCTQRHATSKLTTLKELFEITHLGFRGEAIPSIASVSHFKICTRQPKALEGWEIRIDGGQEQELKSSGISPGTTIEVADLFFNTPARRKFLKSAETEASHIEHQIRLHALAYPQVRFTYKRDDQLIFDLPASTDLRVRISALTDTATATALIPIEPTLGPGISITGFLLPLSEARRTRKGQYVFMNSRPVEDQLINRAIRDGYGGFPAGLHPALFLYMEVEPALVDVNVHPAKKEVRFRRSADVVNTIIDAITNTLQKHARKEQPSQPEPDAPPQQRPQHASHSAEMVPVAEAQSPRLLTPVPLRAVPAIKQVPVTQGRLDFKSPVKQDSSLNKVESKTNSSEVSTEGFTYLGTLRKQFAMFETQEGLVLMHPKAARERIIFEHLRERQNASIPTQELLDPIVLDLDPRDFAVITQCARHFDQAGITITPFGQNTIRIESIPALLELDNVRAFLLELVDRLTQSEFSRNIKHMAYEVFIGEMAKKSAWKEQISPHRFPAILKELLACEVPYCTPTGKPTLINYSIPEIKRRFGIQS